MMQTVLCGSTLMLALGAVVFWTISVGPPDTAPAHHHIYFHIYMHVLLFWMIFLVIAGGIALWEVIS